MPCLHYDTMSSVMLVVGLAYLALSDAILLQEETSYSEMHPLPSPSSHNGPSSQNDQERRMRLFYLEKKPLLNTSVLCNDGSPAGYYIRKSELSSNWLIFLEGGSYCFDQVSCSDRRAHDPRLISSQLWPANRRAPGIVSGDRTENPLYANETIVLIPYCSSDLWSGSSMIRSNVSDFYFMGSLIVKELVKQLLDNENMTRANRILLTGTSAGGIGALLNYHNVKSLVESHARRNRIHPAPQIRTFVDSSWFLSITDQDIDKMDRLLPSDTSRQSNPKPVAKSNARKSLKTTVNWFNGTDLSTSSTRKSRGRLTATTTQRVTTGRRRKEQCSGLLGCKFALKETIKSASIVWHSDLPHDCTRLPSNVNKPWHCLYPSVLLRSMQKSKNPIPVFILQNIYDRAQMQMDSGFGSLRLGPAYLEALRDKMRTTLIKTKPLFVGIFAPACFGHEILNRHEWSKLTIENSSVVDALRCWEHKLNMRNQRALSALARRTNMAGGSAAQANERGFWTIFRTVSSQQDLHGSQSTGEPKCNSRLFELDSYPLSNARCPAVLTQTAYRIPVDRISILREFGYSEVQINRLLNLTDRNKLTTTAPRRKSGRQIRFPARIPLP